MVNFDRVFDHNILIMHVYTYVLEREENDDDFDVKISTYRVRLQDLPLLKKQNQEIKFKE
jgi:hypothetical protein